MLVVTLTPSWLVWILTVTPIWLYFHHSGFVLFSFVFEHKTMYYMSVSCVWFLLPSVNLQSNWVWKHSKLGLSSSFSLWGFFVSALIILQLQPLACLLIVVWFVCCYFPTCLFPNFTFNCKKKKKLEKSPGKGWTWYNLAGGMTALANLYALYSGGARSFNQWHRALYPNLIININSLCSHHSSITAPGMFTNCCLVCLLLFSDLPVPKFHFQLQKKKKTREKSWKRLDMVQFGRWHDSFS